MNCESESSVNAEVDEQVFTRRDSFMPMAPKNAIASTYSFTTQELVTEATALEFFTNTTEARLTMEILADGEVWRYEASFTFDWILPLLYPTTDVSIEGIEVTQAIQTATNEVRLVEGKDTLARVFIDSGEFTSVEVKVTLHYCVLVFCIKSIEKTHTAVQDPQRENYLDSANFQLPPDWVTHPGIDDPIAIGLYATVEHLSPGGQRTYLDPNQDNDDLFYVAWFNSTHDLNLHYVPLTFNGSQPSPGMVSRGISGLDAVFPTNVNPVEIDTRLFRTAADYTAGDFKVQGVELLNVLMVYSDLTGNIPYPDQLALFFPSDQPLVSENSGNTICGSSTPEWGTGGDMELHSFVTISKLSHTCIARNIVAHELNHNLGPNGGTFVDTWSYLKCSEGAVDVNGNGVYDPGIDECDKEETLTASETVTWGVGDGTWGGHIGPECNASGDDVDWEALYGNDRTIEDLGWTSWFSDTETNPNSLLSSDMRELQGYCADSAGNIYFNKWISIYRWNHLYDLFSDWEVGNPTGRSEDLKTRLVTFSLGQNGSGKLHYTHVLDGHGIKANQQEVRPQGERYEIRAFDEANTLVETAVVVKHPHELQAKHEGLEGEEYTSVVMFTEDNPVVELQLVHVDSEGRETLVDGFDDRAKPAQMTMDELPKELPSRDENFTLSWSVADAQDMPDVLYQLEYGWGQGVWLPIGIPSSDTSVTMNMGMLPGGPESNFRIRAMNGMATSYATSTPFAVPFQPPSVELRVSENLQDGTITYGESFGFEATFTDPDWAAPHLTGCKASLVNEEGKVVWGEGALITARLLSTSGAGETDDVHSGCSNVLAQNKIGVNFPNQERLVAELLPGEYALKIEYTDHNGGTVHEKFEFEIEVASYQTVDYRETLLLEFREALTQVTGDTPGWSINELRFVATLQSMEANETGDAELAAAELAKSMQISEARRTELLEWVQYRPSEQPSNNEK